jgi:hypothetical protein
VAFVTSPAQFLRQLHFVIAVALAVTASGNSGSICCDSGSVCCVTPAVLAWLAFCYSSCSCGKTSSEIAVAFVLAVLASASFVIAVALAVTSSEIAVAFVCDSGSVCCDQPAFVADSGWQFLAIAAR